MTCERSFGQFFAQDGPLVIFDVGSCEGEDSIRYSRLFPRARIYTFEPFPANQAIIRENFARYGADRSELVPFALSDHAGKVEFNVSAGLPPGADPGDGSWNHGNKSGSILPPAGSEPMHGWLVFPKKITVPCDTLDRFCSQRGIRRIDFIHLDVQGAESLVLAGGARILPKVGAIWMEVSDRELYRGQKLRPVIEKTMRRHGFWLASEKRGDVESDQFYVNLRTLPGLTWWFGALFRPLRRLLGLIPSSP